jgi:hypothetical protein
MLPYDADPAADPAKVRLDACDYRGRLELVLKDPLVEFSDFYDFLAALRSLNNSNNNSNSNPCLGCLPLHGFPCH